MITWRRKNFANGEKSKSVFAAMREIAESSEGEKIRVETFAKGLGRRSFGFMLVVLNLPNLIPLPLPFLSVIFGFPLSLVAAQLAIGWDRPWLPRFLRERGIGKKEMLYFCEEAEKKYGWAHKLIVPRWLFFTRGNFVRIIGLAISVLAIVMVLPIPFGNLVLAIPIALMSLGLLERDGAFVITGFVLGICGMLFNLFIASSLLLGLLRLPNFFG